MYVYREMWVGGAYGSYLTKNRCEDWALGHDALASDDAFVLIHPCVVCGTNNHDTMCHSSSALRNQAM